MPPALCARLADDARIALRLGHTAETLTQTGTGWRAAGRDAWGAAWAIEAETAEHAPALRAALGEADIERLDGRAAMRCSAPLSMPLVGEVQAGLYCSLAHGTRGLLTAGLAGETVAALACGQLTPMPAPILAALAPCSRGIRKQ